MPQPPPSIEFVLRVEVHLDPRLAAALATQSGAAADLPPGVGRLAPAIGQVLEHAEHASLRGGAGPTAADARQALVDIGMQRVEALLGSYTPARIVQVIGELRRQKKPIKNAAGWVRQALRRGWCFLPSPDEKGDT